MNKFAQEVVILVACAQTIVRKPLAKRGIVIRYMCVVCFYSCAAIETSGKIFHRKSETVSCRLTKVFPLKILQQINRKENVTQWTICATSMHILRCWMERSPVPRKYRYVLFCAHCWHRRDHKQIQKNPFAYNEYYFDLFSE